MTSESSPASRTVAPVNTVTAAMMLVSWVAMPCTTHSPMPCQPKIFSVNTAPVTKPLTP